ncbi:unnamed protein product [Musa acuminata var. zebrina]
MSTVEINFGVFLTMKTVEEEQKLLIQNGMSYEAQDMKSDKGSYFVCEISFAQELSTTAEDALMF